MLCVLKSKKLVSNVYSIIAILYIIHINRTNYRNFSHSGNKREILSIVNTCSTS